MDLTESIAPRSDQVNADDLIGGPATYTIREVRQGAAEQPFDFMLVETNRAYRPSKTMRRVIVAAWGPDANVYAGRRLTLYREPTIKFGGQTVGGIRISHMSHIGKRVEVLAQVTRGKREKFTVDPLPDNAPGAPAVQSDGITGPMLSKLQILLKECGVTDRDTALAYYARVTGREVDSSKALTRNEAGQVLSDLERVRNGEPNLLDPASANDPALDAS